jgi:chloramphenicol-sensitive protein RarD
LPDDVRRGTAYGAGAYLLWGLFPLYWPLLEPADPVEILSHRVVWSLIVVLVILALQRRWRWIRTLDRRGLCMMAIAAVLIAINWLTYIYGVNSGQVVETSLGYFITPILSVLLGVVLLRERLRPAQWTAISLGTLAVVILRSTTGGSPGSLSLLRFPSRPTASSRSGSAAA